MISVRSWSRKGTLTTRTGRTLPRYPRSTNQSSPRWMGGRGMAVVLVPDFGSELVQGLARDVSVVTFQAVEPNDEVMTLVLWKRQDAIFQFSDAHCEMKMPRKRHDFKPSGAYRSQFS